MATEKRFAHWFTGSRYMHLTARAIAQHGPIARTPLAQLLGLSQGALSRLTSDLIHANVIEEMPDAGGTPLQGFFAADAKQGAGSKRGRPQTALRLRAEERSFVGVNIHGTDISVVAVDALCRPISECHDEALASTQPEAVARQIAEAVKRQVAPMHPAPVLLAVSMGGHLRDDRTVTEAPFLHWNHKVALAAMVESLCGIPCLLVNDLDALLLHESWFGAGVGVPRFTIVTIGLGVGYALCEHGEPVVYPDKSYGLATHILVDPEGPRCYAGHTGCANCMSSDSLAEEYSLLIGRSSTFEEFVADATAGRPQARMLVDRLCYRLGVFIATMENLTMPDKVLVSGESSFLARLNIESIRSAINSYRPSQASKVDFEILDFSWSKWSEAAAAYAIAQYIG